jgi:thiamine biosynthesis lipoprotein
MSLFRMRFSLAACAGFFILNGCQTVREDIVKISGEAQGTTYHITYISGNRTDYREAIDSIFIKIDSSLSTYIPFSIISRINRNDSTVVADEHFTSVFNKAAAVAAATGGIFDVTIAPVINAWGFGFAKKSQVDSLLIDSLLGLVGYQNVKLEGNRVVKARPGLMLDFNAIAPGYTVDLLSSFLEGKGIHRYIIELGGEVRAAGMNDKDKPWTVGIDQPNEADKEGRPLQAIISLRDRALATSGNYRRFYIENGQKRAHIIDPGTGYPAKHNLLSATVLAADCATADAYATAFMVMGVEKAKQFLATHKDLRLDVFFIFDVKGTWETYTTEGLKHLVSEIP